MIDANCRGSFNSSSVFLNVAEEVLLIKSAHSEGPAVQLRGGALVAANI